MVSVCRVIEPSLESLADLRTPLNNSERHVLDFFDKHLPAGWEIYVQPHLNGLRPDFVLLHPQNGVAVFEVKDWDLNALEYEVRKGDSFGATMMGSGSNDRIILWQRYVAIKKRSWISTVRALGCSWPKRMGLRRL